MAQISANYDESESESDSGSDSGNSLKSIDSDHEWLQDNVLAESKVLKLVIYRSRIRNCPKFAYDDRQFELKVVMKRKGHPPLLMDLLTLLVEGVQEVIKRLQAHYGKTPQRQLFISITDREASRNGINSENQSLNGNSRQMAVNIISQFHNFLQSNQSLQVSRSFGIYFRILSVAHAQQNVDKGKMIPHYLDDCVGCDIEFPNLPEFFSTVKIVRGLCKDLLGKKCLVLTFILGLILNYFFEGREKLSFRTFFSFRGKVSLLF